MALFLLLTTQTLAANPVDDSPYLFDPVHDCPLAFLLTVKNQNDCTIEPNLNYLCKFKNYCDTCLKKHNPGKNKQGCVQGNWQITSSHKVTQGTLANNFKIKQSLIKAGCVSSCFKQGSVYVLRTHNRPRVLKTTTKPKTTYLPTTKPLTTQRVPETTNKQTTKPRKPGKTTVVQIVKSTTTQTKTTTNLRKSTKLTTTMGPIKPLITVLAILTTAKVGAAETGEPWNITETRKVQCLLNNGSIVTFQANKTHNDIPTENPQNKSHPHTVATPVCNPAHTCGCHRGSIHCDGYLTNGVKQVPISKHCVLVVGQSCWGANYPVRSCHEHGHYIPEETYVILLIQVAISVALTAAITVCSIRRTPFGLRRREWCTWNCFAILLILILNKCGWSKAIVMQAGSCDSKWGCLEQVYKEGKCKVIGYSVDNLKVTYGSQAWCWHHDCCDMGKHLYDIYECKNGEYNWASGCGVAGRGCHVCGAKVEGDKVPIYEVVTEKTKCIFRKGGKKYPLNCGKVNEKQYLSLEKHCVANEPHHYTPGPWNYKGEVNCNCPDPWHCGQHSALEFDSVCKKNTVVKVQAGTCSYTIDEPIEVQVKHCSTTVEEGETPCLKEDGTFCYDKGCKALENARDTTSWHEDVVDFSKNFLPDWMNPWNIFDIKTIILGAVVIILILLLLFKK